MGSTPHRPEPAQRRRSNAQNRPKAAPNARPPRQSRTALTGHRGDVVVMFADSPLIETATIMRLRAALDAGAHVAVLAFEPADPSGYGRLIADPAGRITAIREHKDASEAERKIGLCAAGAMAFRVPSLVDLLGRIGKANASGEYYLTDVAVLAAGDGLTVKPVISI